jgi:hypothetical protein
MKKNILFLALVSIFTFSVSAQQFENAGFEHWENAGTVKDEPVDWSSIKTSDGGTIINNAAPVVWWQSDDAHTGNYSIELQNILTLGTIVATGIITSGRVHASFTITDSYTFTDPTDPRWNSPLTKRPDSVAIWVKYFPQGNDTARCQFSIHTGECSLPPRPDNEANRVGYAEINITDTIDTWTRVVAPFEYFNNNTPEYILSHITSGAGWNPAIGSIARYDDLELIYKPSSIGDKARAETLIYSAGNTIYLDKVPQDKLINASLEVFNLSGQVIYSAPVTTNAVSLDMGKLSHGIYMVHVFGKSVEVTQKVLLQ